MLNRCQILVIRLALGISMAYLSACGQQGALYLPTEAVTAPQPAASGIGNNRTAAPTSSRQP